MKIIVFFMSATAVLGVSGCETPQSQTTRLLPPPEYLSCDMIATELAIADKNTLQKGVYNSFGAYWAKRSERLSARAMECKSAR